VSAQPAAPRVRAWAACGARAAGGAHGGITVIFANFDETPAPVALAIAGGASPGDIRHEYILTAGDADASLASSTIALNGAILAMGDGLLLPALPPRIAPATSPLVLPPLSYGFIVLPDAQAAACYATSG
jgi:hypothetical protein